MTGSAQLEALTAHATAWAKCYCRLVEALRTEGLTEDAARTEANQAATTAILNDAGSGEGPPF